MVTQDSTSIRKPRAKTACFACRRRKVRCDVVVRGSPCTNCFLDCKQCRVDYTSRSGRRRIDERSLVRAPTVISPPATTTSPPTTHHDRLAENPLPTARHVSPQHPLPQSLTPVLLADLLKSGDDAELDADPSWGPEVADISFISYRFLRSDFIARLRQDDIKYLEDQACFRMPRREILDVMLTQFFLRIHPLLPIFDESRFWLMYQPAKHASDIARTDSLSLFEMQAILFVACSFVGLSKLRQLGFESARHARRSFYQRAKLLYSFDTETDPMSLAQGSLLLSLWCPRANNHHSNTMWLSTAIQYARATHAHCYKELTHLPLHERSHLKRLWWSCMVRDRLTSLGLRRPIHITRDSFNFDAGPLTADDLVSEETGPTVYGKEINRVLVLITVALSEFSSLLTDVLSLVYPPSGTLPQRLVKNQSDNFLHLKRVRQDMKAWHRDVSSRLAMIPSYHRSQATITLFSNLLHMYIHSSFILLANFQLQQEVELVPSGEQDETRLHQAKTDVRDSSRSITELLRELVDHDLVKYLPLSVVTCTAQPLLLNLLDQSLARQGNKDSTDVHSRLAVVLQAMKVYQSLYDKTDDLLSTAHRISLEVQSVVEDRTVASWDDVLAKNPRAYLRLIWIVDLALAKGSFPKDSDLPPALQSLSPDSRRTLSEAGSSHNDSEKQRETESIAFLTPPELVATSVSSSSNEFAFDDTLLMRSPTGTVDGDESNATSLTGSSVGFGQREALIVENDLLIQNLLQSYLVDDAIPGGNTSPNGMFNF